MYLNITSPNRVSPPSSGSTVDNKQGEDESTNNTARGCNERRGTHTSPHTV